MTKSDLKSQCKSDEIRIAMEREASLGTAIEDEVDHHDDQEDEALCKMSI